MTLPSLISKFPPSRVLNAPAFSLVAMAVILPDRVILPLATTALATEVMFIVPPLSVMFLPTTAYAVLLVVSAVRLPLIVIFPFVAFAA